MEKEYAKHFREKTSTKVCPNAQPIAGIYLLIILKKTSLYEKTGSFAPKTQFLFV